MSGNARDFPGAVTRYRGRFAPSPTGPLHFGSLVAAVGSYLCAREAGGQWLVRMEDIDPPREVPGAAADILQTLEVYGFEWDDEVLYQSRRADAYEAALDRLRQAGALYACGCTRKEIADSSMRGIDGLVYPGTCRAGHVAGRAQYALRVRTDNAGVIAFTDRVLGEQRADLEKDYGDFVVRRADGLFAYQLACVVDDAEQSVSEIVRGADLLTSTPRQIHLQRVFGYTTPGYAHLPIATNVQGEKLSKQTLAAPIRDCDRLSMLTSVMAFLGQDRIAAKHYVNLDEFWRYALAHWRSDRVPRVTTYPAPPSLPERP